MAGYIGSTPVPQGIKETQSFTATAGQTTFNTLGYSNGNNISVFLNGVRLINGTDYTATNGSDIVLTAAASASDVLDFETFNEFNLVNQNLTTPTFTDTVVVSGDTTATVTLKNNTEEDTDGGRESTLIFQGEQSGGEISTLAEIEASHDGTADDQKGDLIFRTNDGSDGTSPTEVMRLDSGGTVNISSPSNARALKLKNSANNSASQITFLSDDGTEDSFIRNQSSTTGTDILSFGTGGSERMRILAAGGLTFNGDTAAANALNDYEYGTFSPTYSTTNNDATGVTYSAYNAGSYVKIGNVVHFQMQLSINAMTSAGSGVPKFGGLPFNSASSAPMNETTRYPLSTYNVDYVASSTAGYMIHAYVPTSGVNFLQILLTQDAYAWSVLNTSQFALSAGNYVSIMGTYFAD